jgi:hypothetical protein
MPRFVWGTWQSRVAGVNCQAQSALRKNRRPSDEASLVRLFYRVSHILEQTSGSTGAGLSNSISVSREAGGISEW